MSQHVLTTKVNGQQLQIQMGWDTPMSWYYLVISPVIENGELDDPIYSNLNELHPESNPLKYYIEVCHGLGIQIPETVIQGIEEDRRLDRMNNRVWYEYVE